MSKFISLTIRNSGQVVHLRKLSIKRVTPRDLDCTEVLQDGAPSLIEVVEDEDGILSQLEQDD